MSDDEQQESKPYEWSALYDAEGNIYYHNERTDETTWDAPEQFNPPEKDFEEIKAKEKEGTWEKHQNDEGNTFYYNTATEVTTWDRPDGYQSGADDDGDDEDGDGDDNDDNGNDDAEDDKLPSSPIGGPDDEDKLPSSPVGGPDDDDVDDNDNDEDKGNLPSSPVGGPDDDDDDDEDNDDDDDEPRRAGDWEEHDDGEGNKYYHNVVTDETTWDRPPEFDDADKKGLSSPKHGLDDDDEDHDEKKAEEAAAPEATKTEDATATASAWEKVVDEEGREYYHNTLTEVTQWEKPDDFVEASAAVAAAPTGGQQSTAWEKLTDEEGREYYYNSVTEVTQWERPDDFVESSATATETAPPEAAMAKGQWEKLTDDEGREYYHNIVSEVTQWEKPDDFDEAAVPTAESVKPAAAAGAWEKATDDEGREYYYNTVTEVTQWEKPDDFVEEQAVKMEEEPLAGVSPKRSPSPQAMEIEEEKPKEEEKSPEPEIDPAIKKIRDAEEALSKPDSVMEPGCIANVVEVVASQDGNPEKAILSLIESFQGQTAICGTLAKWLADLRSADSKNGNGNVNDVVGTAPQSIADGIRGTAQDVIDRVAKERFTKTGGDSILNLSKSEAAFLEDMMDSKRWRTLLIDLTASNKDSALLMYCLRAISKRGYHREIVRRINQSEHFSVFNAMLQSELAVVGKTAISASSDVDTSIGLEELVNDLRRTCTATAYTYLYSVEVLRHLVTIAEEDAESARGKESLRFRRAIRKWERLSQDLDSAMVDPNTSNSTAGSSHLFRKRRLDVALTVSELHQGQRRRRKPSPGEDVVLASSANEQMKAMETGLLNFLRRYSVGTQVDDRVLDALLPTGLNMQEAADEAGKLLIAHPLAIRALLGHMFTSGSARVPPATKNKCARLIALATLASEKKARSEMLERQIGQEGQDEVALTRMLVQGCQLCESVQLMASFVVTTDGVQNEASASPGHRLCALALKCAPVAQGTMLWAREITKNGEFLTSATYPTFSPSLLSLVRIIALRHPCTRLEAAEIAFIFLTHSSTAEVSYKKINEIKEQCLRLLLFLIINGEAASILRKLTTRLQQQDTIKLDASLLRYFVGGLLEVVRPPFSLPFVRLLGAMLKTAKCIEAVRSAYFGEANQERLKSMLTNFKESLSHENGAASSDDTALVSFLVKTYGNKAVTV